MKRSALFGCLLACSLLLLLLPRNTEGIELPNQAVLINNDDNAGIYPNPVKDFLFVRPGMLNAVWTQNASLQFEIRNILGNLMPVEAERIEPDEYRIDAADYPPGYYLLMIQCNSCEVKGHPSRNAFKFLKQ